MGSSPTRGSSFFLGKVTALGVLCCFTLFVCLTLLASFFLPSHLSFKNIHIYLKTRIHADQCRYRPLYYIVPGMELLGTEACKNPIAGSSGHI